MQQGESRRIVRAIGFGENGDSVGVDGVLNEGGNRIRGFDLQGSKPKQRNSERDHYEYTPP